MKTSREGKTAHLDIRVDPALVERIDRWRDRSAVPPTRAAAIVHMIERFLDLAGVRDND